MKGKRKLKAREKMRLSIYFKCLNAIRWLFEVARASRKSFLPKVTMLYVGQRAVLD